MSVPCLVFRVACFFGPLCSAELKCGINSKLESFSRHSKVRCETMNERTPARAKVHWSTFWIKSSGSHSIRLRGISSTYLDQRLCNQLLRTRIHYPGTTPGIACASSLHLLHHRCHSHHSVEIPPRGLPDFTEVHSIVPDTRAFTH